MQENKKQSQIDHIQEEVNALHIQYVKGLLWKVVVQYCIMDQKIISKATFEEVERDAREIFKMIKKKGDYPGILQDAVAEFRTEYQKILQEK
jgi:hypothetical protein